MRVKDAEKDGHEMGVEKDKERRREENYVNGQREAGGQIGQKALGY